MKILRLIGEIGPDVPSGPARMAYHLTTSLAAKGFTSIVYCFDSSSNFNADGITLKRFQSQRILGHYRFSKEMVKEIMYEEADLIHAHGYRNFESDLGALYSVLKKVPLVMTTHGTVQAPFIDRWTLGSKFEDFAYDAFTMRFSILAASKVVATSSREAQELSNFGVARDRIDIIPNAVYAPWFARTSRPQTKKVRILVVSRLTAKNGLDLAIRSFAKAVKSEPEMSLSIVGGQRPSKYASLEERYQKRLKDLCRLLGIESDVEFLGWKSGEALWDEYRKADIYLWASYYDNFGHSLVEAAHFGLPIISTDVGIARALVGKDEGGYIVRWDSDEISKALLALARDKAARDKMGAHSQSVSKQFGLEQMADAYARLYLELIGTCVA